MLHQFTTNTVAKHVAPRQKKATFNHRPPGVQISSDQGVGGFCVDRSCGMFFHG